MYKWGIRVLRAFLILTVLHQSSVCAQSLAIDSLSVKGDSLKVFGDFGSISGMVLLEGVAVPVINWTPGIITCDYGMPGYPRAGKVEVVQGNTHGKFHNLTYIALRVDRTWSGGEGGRDYEAQINGAYSDSLIFIFDGTLNSLGLLGRVFPVYSFAFGYVKDSWRRSVIHRGDPWFSFTGSQFKEDTLDNLNLPSIIFSTNQSSLNIPKRTISLWGTYTDSIGSMPFQESVTIESSTVILKFQDSSLSVGDYSFEWPHSTGWGDDYEYNNYGEHLSLFPIDIIGLSDPTKPESEVSSKFTQKINEQFQVTIRSNGSLLFVPAEIGNSVRVSICNTLGERVFCKQLLIAQGSETTQLQLPYLTSGTYFMALMGDTIQQVSRFTILR